MSYACHKCSFPNSAADDDDDGDDDGDGQCGNVGIGFCLLQHCKREKNNEHLVRRKGVLWIWLGKSSVRLPACLTVRIVVVVVSTARLCSGCAHEKFIHSVEFRA